MEIIKGRDYIKIAENGTHSKGGGLYIEIGTGNLFHFSPELEDFGLNNEFCNSSIELCMLFETIIEKTFEKYPKAADDALEGYECAREMIEQFKETDMSVVYPYSYWANTLLDYAVYYFYDNDHKFDGAVQNGHYPRIEDAYFDALFNGFEVLDGKY